MLNSKTLKSLRRFVRSQFAALPARKLLQPTVTHMVPNYSLGLNLDGTPKLVPMAFPVPARNDPNTQRAKYRVGKKLLARA